MTTDEKLAAILAAVQTDPGNRGLARDPHDNLFTATAGQFQAACRSIAEHPSPRVRIYTGFFIPTAEPPAFETDGPLGALVLRAIFRELEIPLQVCGEYPVVRVAGSGDRVETPTHLIALERPGPTADGSFRTMRGRDITQYHQAVHAEYEVDARRASYSIGIGDGGNEIGMGKISPEVIASNVYNGTEVHCRVATDYLIVAGVSNWGAYALAAGVALLRGKAVEIVKLLLPDADLPVLRVMVKYGPLVDGVTGRQEATVDGLPWDVYAAPLLRIREILELP